MDSKYEFLIVKIGLKISFLATGCIILAKFLVLFFDIGVHWFGEFDQMMEGFTTYIQSGKWIKDMLSSLWEMTKK